MNPRQELKVLELDLSGVEVSVGVEKLFKRDLVRELGKLGVGFNKGPKSSYDSGETQEYVKKHLEEGHNYAIIDGSVVLDSQFEWKSLFSNYYSPGKKSGTPIYLGITAASKAKDYGRPKKVGPDELDEMVKGLGIRYKPMTDRFVDVLDIEKFGSKVVEKEPETVQKKVESPAKEERRYLEEELPNGWQRVVGKRYEIGFPISKDIRSPRMEFMALEDFDLDLLEKYFRFPKHQRKISRDHVLKMAAAAGINKFYSNAIEVMQKKPPFDVEDGKQTLHMLSLMRDYAGWKKYNIYLMRRLDGKPVEIFEGSNIGKKMNINDRSNMLGHDDDVKVPFYKELGQWLVHYKKPGQIKFIDMGRAYMYAKENMTHVKDAEVLDYIPKISKSEVQRTGEFLGATMDNLGEDGSFMKRQGVMANLLKVFLETKMSENRLKSVLEVLKKDPDVLALSRSTNIEDYEKLYKIVLKDAKRVR